MNWEAIGVVVDIIGAVIVVATVFYLAVQIKQSHSTNQMQVAAYVAESTQAWLSQLVQDKELHDLYQTGSRDYNSLELSEKRRFHLLILQFLRVKEAHWGHEKQGLLDKNLRNAFEMTMRDVIGSPGGRVVFEKVRHRFSSEFYTDLDEILSTSK